MYELLLFVKFLEKFVLVFPRLVLTMKQPCCLQYLHFGMITISTGMKCSARLTLVVSMGFTCSTCSTTNFRLSQKNCKETPQVSKLMENHSLSCLGVLLVAFKPHNETVIAVTYCSTLQNLGRTNLNRWLGLRTRKVDQNKNTHHALSPGFTC